jgi:hypothetical protein
VLLCGSATSLYALGVQAGYSWWQAAAVPVVADGPAIYGMFRIVSRSRRGARGVGYGWLLVIAGTLASIGGNVAHARPDLVAQLIAAAIPLAVLAMLEGLKGDAGEVTRLAARADPDHATALDQPGQSPHGTTVRRTDTTALLDGAGAASGSRRPALPAGPSPTDRTSVGARLQAAYANRRRTSGPGRPAPWPRLPAVAAAAPPASCNASAHQLGSAPNEPPQCGSAGRRPRLCLPGIPVLPLHYPLPTATASSLSVATRSLQWDAAARAGIRAAASPPSTPWARWSPTGSRTPPVTGPGSWPGGPATPGQHRPRHRPPLRRPGRRRARRCPGHPVPGRRPWPAQLRAAGPHWWGWLAFLRG